MDKFYIIVLSIAAVLLILILTYVGLLMTSKSASTQNFPPTVASCPDYWPSGVDPSSCAIPVSGSKNTGSIYDINNNNAILLNGNNTPGYSATNKAVVFAHEGWSAGGSNTTCAQKKWATQYGIQWDGISNFNGC
jgi:hypothetical protein